MTKLDILVGCKESPLNKVALGFLLSPPFIAITFGEQVQAMATGFALKDARSNALAQGSACPLPSPAPSSRQQHLRQCHQRSQLPQLRSKAPLRHHSMNRATSTSPMAQDGHVLLADPTGEDEDHHVPVEAFWTNNTPNINDNLTSGLVSTLLEPSLLMEMELRRPLRRQMSTDHLLGATQWHG